ncbi:MAG TPA: phosphomannomutase/phosphoglucomutase [Alphaproteobacteria bacterium]|nr:phosphomannomutase/phosphoglucomutase [Alphaproteobacteria bacterium]
MLITKNGFREYDARWLLNKELDLEGAEALGLALATLIHERGIEPKLVTGHDYRSYSESVKNALIKGLLAGGIEVHDIGLAVTPMAYYAQFALNIPCVAMCTASHNENGWTGVKMGMEKPLTFGPDEMGRLRDITLNGEGEPRSGGKLVQVEDFAARYLAHNIKRGPYTRKIKAIVACGNGTAGAFAPEALRALGVEVIERYCGLDHSFPHYNPNPEDLTMLHDMAAQVREHGADLALGFDGDGDRCGVVMNNGEELFADKLGVLIARNIAAAHPGSTFVVDVKSTGIYAIDPLLKQHNAKTEYWKTGHSYIKRRTAELGAIAGFEKSGHYFFNQPYGLGYDDALVSAIAVLDLLENNPGKSLADLAATLPQTFGSPTMAPHCDDDKKYGVVEALSGKVKALTDIIGQKITGIVTVNGVRFTVADGTWGLIRASSNKPELVVVVESPVSAAHRNAMFAFIEGLLAQHPEVGTFNQKLS